MNNLQNTIEQERAIYETLKEPFLYQLAKLHGISIRDFASIFEISKGHAEAILKHKTFPSLELAIRIARYWECSVEDLFGWRVDDHGDRRPLLVEMPGGVVRLTSKNSNSVGLMKDLAEAMKTGGVEILEKKLRRAE